MKKYATQPISTGRQLNEAGENSANEKKKKSMIIILAVLVLLIVCILGLVIWLLLHKDNEEKSILAQKRDTVVTIDNKDAVLSDLNDKLAKGLFEARMNVSWSFKDSSTPSKDAYVANVTTNSNTIYFDVTLDSTGEAIYKSPYIPVGYALEDIALTADLAAGTYPCTLVYHLVDDNDNEISTMAVAVTIHVQN